MKAGKLALLAALCACGSTVFGQGILPAITVVPANYKYLKQVGGKEVAVPAQRLQRMAASYDVKNSEFYEEDYDTYFISFSLPEGEVLAAYDKDGKLMRTAERYTNVRLPGAVTKAVGDRFPNWGITKDAFLVNYYDAKGGQATKRFKLVLENGSKRIRVQLNEKGEFS